jgi:hypothetical protein
MIGGVRLAAAFLALLSILLGPVVPPAHVHRTAGPGGHARVLIHRHFAPHTSSAGTHVERRGVADGAPTWIEDPAGLPPHQYLVAPDTTRTLLDASRPPPDRVSAIALASGVLPHAPPRSPAGLRGPPHRA